MDKKWLYVFLSVGLIVSLHAQHPVWMGDARSASLRYAMTGLGPAGPAQAVSSGTPGAASLKKPGRGALFSAIVPGAGEMYGGSWLKGALFLGAEIALWSGYVVFYNEGVDWRNQFHDYADAHWSEPAYWVSIAWDAGLSGVTTDNYMDYLEELRAWEHEHHHHTLPEERTQQYFEVIGKYDLFVGGWDDYHGQPNKLTPHRNEYENMRNSSNVEFKRASTCAMVAMANHLFSALDAAWTISRKNRAIRTALHMEVQPVRNEMLPMYGLQIEW